MTTEKVSSPLDGSRSPPLPPFFCLVECDAGPFPMRFFLMDAPSPSNLPLYVRELQKRNVKHLVRVCSATYQATVVTEAGIELHHWPFDDGDPPPREIVSNWLTLAKKTFSEGSVGNANPPAIAIHCIAGLGRAPVLVAIALIELGKMDPMDAISHIRQRRKGAINATQLQYILKYKPRKNKPNCVLM
eukprot:TRINITY_DN71262_c0_g1_i1.p1 TRINITY_DN71262_c0_g1~~TRINITY_DN71262_c0_g1_i1.p1  ORF type:complete len:202 (+),score=28.58 TRINITY_DN71262_c0_g1_i1:43-606(+)